MNRPTRFALLAVLATALILPACTKLLPWTPVRDGADLDVDHVVLFEGVEIHAREFGILAEKGLPSVEVRTHNQGERPVAFGIDGFRLDIGGTLVPARLNEEGEFPSVYLEPGEIYNTRLTFVPPQGDGADELPEMLYLHLAPLVIDEVYHELPVLAYRRPLP